MAEANISHDDAVVHHLLYPPWVKILKYQVRGRIQFGVKCIWILSILHYYFFLYDYLYSILMVFIIVTVQIWVFGPNMSALVQSSNISISGSKFKFPKVIPSQLLTLNSVWWCVTRIRLIPHAPHHSSIFRRHATFFQTMGVFVATNILFSTAQAHHCSVHRAWKSPTNVQPTSQSTAFSWNTTLWSQLWTGD